MAFQISSQLSYGVSWPSTVLLNIHALSTKRQKLKKEKLILTPALKWEEFPLETGHNRYIRLETGTVPELTLSYTVTADIRPMVVTRDKIKPVPMAQMNQPAIPYLFPSRYCQSDRLGRLALKLFGNIPHPFDQVTAISDWIFDNIDYISGATDAGTSAFDTVTQRAGVCRDFAHLGIALCRALSIPARYVTGYVCLLQPQDFHACFEACIGNKWYLFDPTRLAALNGFVRIATGRDAADASIATIFGGMFLQSMQVNSQCPGFQPIYRQDLDGQAVLLEP